MFTLLRRLFPVLVLLLCCAIATAAAITLNGSIIAGTSNQASPATVTITATSGDLLAACFTGEGGGASLTAFSASDAQGSYTNAIASTDSGNNRQTVLFYLANANAGSHTISVAWTGTASSMNWNAAAFSGVATSTPNDTSGATNNGTIGAGDNAVGVLSTQAQAAEVFVACGRTSTGSPGFTVGSNMTALTAGATGDGISYVIQSTDVHPFTCKMAIAAGGGFSYSGACASFKAAAAGGNGGSMIVGPSTMVGPGKIN